MSSHKLFSPSGASRWMRCPASLLEVQKCKALGLSTSSPAAEEGTEAHAWGYDVLSGKCDINDVPAEMKEAVFTYVKTIWQDLDFGGKIVGLEAPLVWAKDDNVGGTADCITIIGNHLIVTDYKHGTGVYVPADSMQLKIYGWLAAMRIRKPLDTIETRIVQPNYRDENVDPVRSATFNAKQLCDEVESQVGRAIEAYTNTPHKRVPGDHCQWCPAMRVVGMDPCPAHVDTCTALLDMADQPQGMTPLEQVKFILDNEKNIKKMLAFAKDTATAMFLDGQDIEGYELKEQLGDRRWNAPDEEVAKRLYDLGLIKTQVWEQKLCSPTAADKAGCKGQIDDLVTRDSNGFVAAPTLATKRKQKSQEKILTDKLKEEE